MKNGDTNRHININARVHAHVSKQRLASLNGPQPFRPALVNGERVKRRSDNVRSKTEGKAGDLTDEDGR
jgi:hypothetical protein